MTDIAKAFELLDNGGVLDRLKKEAQAEREAERTGLLRQLTDVEARAATEGLINAEQVAQQAKEVAELELKLAAARRNLNEISSGNQSLYAVGNRLRGRLRRLADPAIDEAIADLTTMGDRARSEYRSVVAVSPPDKLTGKRRVEDCGNSEPILEILHDIAAARAQLAAMKEAPRPDNLDAAISAITAKPRNKLRKLVGV